MYADTSHKWKSLTEAGEALSRGALLRFSAGQAFEDRVVMMVCEAPDGAGMALMSITGYKAGINCYVIFPDEAMTPEGISTGWLLANWSQWVWPGRAGAEVQFKRSLSVDEIA